MQTIEEEKFEEDNVEEQQSPQLLQMGHVNA